MRASTALFLATAITSIHASPIGKERRQAWCPWSDSNHICLKARQLLGAVGGVLDAGNDVVGATVKAEDSVDGVTGNEKRAAEPQICGPFSPPGCLKNSKRQLGDALGDVVDAAGGAVGTAQGAVEKREPEPEPQACTPLSPPGCMKNSKSKRQLGDALDEVVDTAGGAVETAEGAVQKREPDAWVVMLKRQICPPLTSPVGCVKMRDLSAEEQDQVSKMKRSGDEAPVVVLKRQICLPGRDPPTCVKERDLTEVEKRQKICFPPKICV